MIFNDFSISFNNAYIDLNSFMNGLYQDGFHYYNQQKEFLKDLRISNPELCSAHTAEQLLNKWRSAVLTEDELRSKVNYFYYEDTYSWRDRILKMLEMGYHIEQDGNEIRLVKD
jgi:hypothetical protein